MRDRLVWKTKDRQREREREDYMRTVLLQSKKRFKRGGLNHRICQRETNGMNKNEIVRIKTPWYAHKVLCWHDMMNDNAWKPFIERNVSKRGCKSWTYPDFPHHVQTKEKERCRLPRGRQANSNIVGGRRRRTKRKEMAGKKWEERTSKKNDQGDPLVISRKSSKKSWDKRDSVG